MTEESEPGHSVVRKKHAPTDAHRYLSKDVENRMIAYCGIDCSKCPSYLATQSGKREELERVAKNLAKVYRAEVKPEFVICDGCRSEGRHSYFCTNTCKMRKCCRNNEFYSCIECSDFPCKKLQFELNNTPEAKSNLEKLKR